MSRLEGLFCIFSCSLKGSLIPGSTVSLPYKLYDPQIEGNSFSFLLARFRSFHNVLMLPLPSFRSLIHPGRVAIQALRSHSLSSPKP